MSDHHLIEAMAEEELEEELDPQLDADDFCRLAGRDPDELITRWVVADYASVLIDMTLAILRDANGWQEIFRVVAGDSDDD